MRPQVMLAHLMSCSTSGTSTLDVVLVVCVSIAACHALPCTLQLTEPFGSKRPASHFESLLRVLLWNDFAVHVERSMTLYQIRLRNGGAPMHTHSQQQSQEDTESGLGAPHTPHKLPLGNVSSLHQHAVNREVDM